MATWMVFDVESIGLHGEGFAAAWVVLDDAGKEVEARREVCPPGDARGPDTGRVWVRDHCPPLAPTRMTPAEVRQEFWAAWAKWKALGAILVADSGWPVEARFLAACVDDVRPAVRGSGKSLPESSREFGGPWPFHELASLMWAVGLDTRTRPRRLENELPEHDPLADVRFSARLLREVLKVRGSVELRRAGA